MDMHRLKNGGEKKEGDAVSQTSSHQRRKKNGDRSKQSSGYLQEWVHQSRSFVTAPQYDPQYSQLVGPYWEVAGSPRMFAAFSDPTVCRYSVPTAPPPPLAYSYEPVSLPIYQPAYQPPVAPNPIGAWRSPQHLPSRGTLKTDRPKQAGRLNVHVSSKHTNANYSSRRNLSNSPLSQQQNIQGAATEEEYLSLPPGTQQGCDLDDSHRRFSDPGLAGTEPAANPTVNSNNNHVDEENESGEWSHESSSSSAKSIHYENVALSEQLNLLKADNRRLAQELRDTRAELHKLKLQAATWGSPIQQDYQPGMITDLVREIRDAAQLREETLLSRLRLMMADGGVLRLTGANTHEKESPASNQNRDFNMNPQDSSFSDDLRDSERISRLERQLNNLQLQNGSEASRKARREEQLRRDLQEAQAARKMAEGNVIKLEKLMNMMRKKMNGVTVSPEHEDERDAERDLETFPGSLASPLASPASPSAAPASTALTTALATAPSSLESLTSACSSNHGATTISPANANAALTGPVTEL